MHWLAQEEAPVPLAPAGYFEQLPRRILRKLPSGRAKGSRHTILWLAAAGLAWPWASAAIWRAGSSGPPWWKPAWRPRDPVELVPDAPFDEGEDVLSQLSELSPEDAEAVLQRLESSPRP